MECWTHQFGFQIPVYENMRSIPEDNPNISKGDYVDDNTKVYADITGNLNVRSGPSTSYEVITKVTRDDKYTRIKKGVQNGERWDKVLLENGIVGYVFQSYLREVPNVIEATDIVLSREEATLLVNDKIVLNASIIPENATDKQVIWESENSSIADVSNIGEVTAKSVGETNIVARITNGSIIKKCRIIVTKPQTGILVEFDNSLDVKGDEISNLDINRLEVVSIRELINTNMIIEFYNNNGEKIEENDLVGTGSKLIIKNNENQVVYEYTFIIYGDVNGDGRINSLDVLVLQKHILEIKPLTGVFLKAANISRNGNMPTSLDVLKIQKHILELTRLEQGEQKNTVNVRIINNENNVQDSNNKNNLEKEEEPEDSNIKDDEPDVKNNNEMENNEDEKQSDINDEVAQNMERDVTEKNIDNEQLEDVEENTEMDIEDNNVEDDNKEELSQKNEQ